MVQKLLFIPLMFLICAGIVQGQVSVKEVIFSNADPVGSNCVDGKVYVNRLTGVNTERINGVCTAVTSGGTPGTVTSVSASGGTETTTGSAITSTGTIRGAQSIRTAAGDPTVIVDGDRAKVVNITFAGGSEIDIAQAGTAGSFAAGWYADVKCSGAGGCQIIPAVSTIDGAAFYNLTNGQSIRVVSDGTNYKTTLSGGPAGITNTAPSGNVPVSDGTNLVAGSLIDNAAGALSVGAGVPLSFSSDTSIGHTAPIQTNTAATSIDNTSPTQTSTASASISHITPLFQAGDVNQTGNRIRVIIDDTNSLIKNMIPLAGDMWGAGITGAEFQLERNGRIIKYNNIAPSDGQVLVGNTAGGTYDTTTLSAGAGIAITNGAGSVTIAQDNANLGAILPVDMSNGVLSQATGTVYSSPGSTSGLTSTTEGNVSFPVPRGGTIRNLFVRSGGTAKLNTPTTVIVVRKNGVDTALTIAALTQTVNTTSSDTVHSFTVVAGDLITLSFVTTGAAAVSVSIAGVSIELD